MDEVALADPRGVAALPDGSFAIADAGLHAVLLVTPDGLVRTLLKPPQVKQPIDVAVSNNSLFVTDTAAGKVIKVEIDGRRHTVARNLERPWQIAVESTGALLVSEVRPRKRLAHEERQAPHGQPARHRGARAGRRREAHDRRRAGRRR